MPTQADSPLPLVLVAHHAADTVTLLRSLLEREGYSVLCAHNGRVARQLVERHRPALALLDQDLSFIDGLDLCRTLRRDSDLPAVFIISDRHDELSKLLAFSAGADDYLPLPIHPRELLARIRVAVRRISSGVTAARPILRCGLIELDLDQRQARAAGIDVPLTALEFELLAVLARHPGRVFSREELLNRLGGFLRGAPLDRAIDIHVSNVRQKLRTAMGGDAPIETVRGAGYRMRMEPGGASVPAGAGRHEGSATLGHVALAALDRAPMPLLALTLDRTVLLYNQAAQALCGWGAQEVAGQVKCYSLLGCHNSEGAMLCYGACPMRDALLSGVNDHEARYVVTLKDGREAPVRARYSRFSVEGDQRDCVLLVLEPEEQTTGAR